jgi:transposase
MYITAIPNRSSPPAILLRESYRESGKVKTRTLANLSDWAPERVEALKQVLRGGTPLAARLEDAFEIVRSRPHGHVAAVLGTMGRLGLDRALGPKRSRERALALAMIAARILRPDSKLATARALDAETVESTLAERLGLQEVDEDDLYVAMDWLFERQPAVEKALAKRHLAENGMVLYDLTSTYFEGRTCPLAKLGYSREGQRGKLQIEFGLLTNAEGCPVAVEVFEGNIGDPQTLAAQVRKLRERFGIQRIVLIGDRGMITDARIREDLATVEGLQWITALRTPAIRKLVDSGSLQLSLFDLKDLAEISDPAYPGERLVVCKNPLLAQERARKRGELLDATERELRKINQATQRNKNPLRGKAKIALRVGKVISRFKVGKHFTLSITDNRFDFARDQRAVDDEAALDGFYVIRTSVTEEQLDAVAVVRAYKRLSCVERAFRSLKTVDLHVRPIHHHKADRVRAHVWLCTLAYYVEWHMRRALAPMLFDDHDRPAGERRRRSIVAPAKRSPAAEAKAADKRTDDGQPVHSFQTLLRDLATVVKNTVQPKHGNPFDIVTRPSPLQAKAFELLGVHLRA